MTILVTILEKRSSYGDMNSFEVFLINLNLLLELTGEQALRKELSSPSRNFKRIDHRGCIDLSTNVKSTSLLICQNLTLAGRVQL